MEMKFKQFFTSDEYSTLSFIETINIESDDKLNQLIDEVRKFLGGKLSDFSLINNDERLVESVTEKNERKPITLVIG